MWKEKLARYDQLIAQHPAIERKGKTMPYTSVNGHMFSQLNKDGQVGLRLGADDRAAFLKQYNTVLFSAYGAVMKEYVLVTEEVLSDDDLFAPYLAKSYAYVQSLKPKKGK
ncbi:MAG: hypothetical protein AAGD05_13760 [Bacteroidota bacterium]